MKRRIIQAIQYIFFLGLGVFLIWWSLKDMTTEEKNKFTESLTHANYWVLIPVIIMALLSHISRALRWRLLIEPLAHKPSFKNTFATVLIGYFANTIFRLGEVLKCTLLSKYEKIPSGQLIGTILIERTIDMFSFFIFIVLTLIIQADIIGSFAKDTFQKIFSDSNGSFSFLKFGIIIAALFLFFLILRFILVNYAHVNVIGKIKTFLKGFLSGLNSIRKMKTKKQFIFHSVFIWLMYLGQIYFAFFALQETTHLGIGASMSVLSLSTFAMIVTPNGIGAFPFAVQKILLIYGISEAIGSSLGWLMWGTSTAIIFIGGIISLLIIPYLNKHAGIKLHS